MRYLALGDSMSIDFYTGQEGGGAAAQFHQMIGNQWEFISRAFDGETIGDVMSGDKAELITLTIGGNDLLGVIQSDGGLSSFKRNRGLDAFSTAHRSLLDKLRNSNPDSIIIVGDIYQPNFESGLGDEEFEILKLVNQEIAKNISATCCSHARIFDRFLGNETEFLCFGIEPNLAGAKAIAEAFYGCYQAAI